jgi:hypothetical protein
MCWSHVQEIIMQKIQVVHKAYLNIFSFLFFNQNIDAQQVMFVKNHHYYMDIFNLDSFFH